MKHVVFVLMVVLCWAGISGNALASVESPDQGEAYAACMAQALQHSNVWYPGSEAKCDHTPGVYVCQTRGGHTGGAWANCTGQFSFQYFATCLTRPDGNAGLINGTQYTGGVCNAGCKMEPTFNVGADDFSIADRGGVNAVNFKRGTWVASGDVCYVDLPGQPTEQKTGCHTTSSGHKVCRGDGRTCVTSPSGFKACAQDSAAGDSAPTTRVNNPRTEGIGISAPNTPVNAPTNREGENWQAGTGGATVTNNNNGNVTNVNNFNNTGTPNGNSPPVPGDGSGNEGEGEGEEPGSVSGGGNCSAPPSILGGDPVANYSALLAWKIQCTGEASEGSLAEAQGAVDELNNCVMLGACMDGDDAPGPGAEYEPESPSDNPELLGSFRDVKDLDDIQLDEGGFLGGGQCPQLGSFSVGGTTIPLDLGPMCTILVNISGFVMAVAYLISFRIIAGGLGGSA